MTAETHVEPLETLEARGLIALAAVDPELEYLFRHWLVQDAAYGSLLRQERRALHARVGAVLEELYPDRRDELAAVLAMHFEQAGQTDRAIAYYLDAAQYAQRRNAIREAFAAFDRAAALLPPAAEGEDAAAARRRVRIRLGRAESGHTFRPLDESLRDLEAATAGAERLGETELSARAHVLAALGRLMAGATPDAPDVRRSLDRVAELAEELGDASLRAMPLALVGMNQVFVGPVESGVRNLEEALPVLDRTQDQIGAAFARGALALGYATLGRFDEAMEAARHATEVAARGDVIAQLDAQIAESMVRSIKGEMDEAIPIARACVLRSEETGAVACAMVSSWVLGDAYHRLGQLEDARVALGRGAAIARVVDRRVWRPTIQAWLATTATALGEAAGGDWDEALEAARAIRNRIGEAGILAKRAEAAAGHGDWEAACADFATSARLFEQEKARPALARLLRGWGDALRAAGRDEEGTARLHAALALFEELGLEREAREVRRALSTEGDQGDPGGGNAAPV